MHGHHHYIVMWIKRGKPYLVTHNSEVIHPKFLYIHSAFPNHLCCICMYQYSWQTRRRSLPVESLNLLAELWYGLMEKDTVGSQEVPFQQETIELVLTLLLCSFPFPLLGIVPSSSVSMCTKLGVPKCPVITYCLQEGLIHLLERQVKLTDKISQDTLNSSQSFYWTQQ